MRKVVYMLANNLKVLLAERNLKIKDVIEHTSLSRNTISNIINRPCSNIATNTIDELCNYLNIYPKDFFIYSPYFIRYIEDEHYLIIEYQNHKYKCDIDIKKVNFNDLKGVTKESLKKSYKGNIQLIEKVFDFFTTRVINNKDFNFEDMFNNLPFVFKDEISHKLIDIYIRYAKDFYKNKNKEIPKRVMFCTYYGAEIILSRSYFDK